jgi:hypothetical protein
MAPSALLGASAVALLLRSAHGLGVGRLAKPTEETQRVKKRSGAWYIEDAIPDFMDADEDDDFDTWLFENHGEDAFASPFEQRHVKPKPPASQPTDEFGHWIIPGLSNGTGEDLALRKISSEELSAYDEAQSQCFIPKKGQPSHPLESAVIAYLVTRPSDLLRLTESLPRLRYYFLKHWPYPVKVFLASDKLRKYDNASFGHSPDKEDVTKLVGGLLGKDYDWTVETFDFKFPKVIENDSEWNTKMNVCAKAVSTSYKHMNQFFTMAMYEHESLKDFRYYMRVDADFNFQATMRADPFCMMKKTGRKFVWQTRKKLADPFCSEGLWDWFHAYQKDHGLTPQDPTFFKEPAAMLNYVGYVGAGDLDFFRSRRVRQLARAFNEDGRVYLNRWSDQTYYVLLFALFENHTAVGDLGFAWPKDEWCHKCPIEGKFDPNSGKIHTD